MMRLDATDTKSDDEHDEQSFERSQVNASRFITHSTIAVRLHLPRPAVQHMLKYRGAQQERPTYSDANKETRDQQRATPDWLWTSPREAITSGRERLRDFFRAWRKMGIRIFENSLFNSALKQSSAVRKDLDVFAENPLTSSPALQGQISASLASLSRTIDDYDSMAKRELIPAKQEKAFERVKNFRSELVEFRQQFERLKADKDETQTTINRAELLGRRPHHASTPENPYNAPPTSSSFRPHPTSAFGASPSDYTRESHALRESSFMSSTNAQLDEFLDRGRAVLGDLGQQREILKGTQRKLYSVANTLGVSGDTIRMVERRAKQDKWIFWGGVVVFFGFCWLVLKIFR
ncbi:hypothetical protein FGG08_007167 [Glutinoglossum americanum]|uniref:Protein transport protein BOS1 n=1 Tax=Glutinoglossum americanum TaxID=1670608 RepID=A0A9P8KZM8_9PEZI|nr:hypothetical protein FGG08_007167 [Glutinoglossum americanum]